MIKVTIKKEPVVRRKLSRKKRKQLEKLLDQKAKKAARGELLAELGSLQVPIAELEKYKSIAHLGTDHTHKALAKLPDASFANKVNTIKGRKRKKEAPKEEEPMEEEKEDEDESSSEDEEETEIEEVEKKEVSGNKEESQLEVQEPKKPRLHSDDEEMEPATQKLDGPKLNFISVTRSEDIQEARLALPILFEEASILESVANNDVIIICGETGSGKTTQLPQLWVVNRRLL